MPCFIIKKVRNSSNLFFDPKKMHKIFITIEKNIYPLSLKNSIGNARTEIEPIGNQAGTE